MARNGCARRNAVRGPTAGSSAAFRGGRERHVGDAHGGEEPAELVLHDIGQRSDHEQRAILAGRRLGHVGHEGRQAGVLAFGEGRLDAAAGIVQDPKIGSEGPVEANRGPRQVELDDLGRAGADQEQQLDVGPALEEPRDDAVEFLVGVGEPSEVALFHDGRGETRLGEDHDAGGRLHEMRAGPRSDDEEEGVLDLAVQPHDPGQAAEDLPLAALAQHRGIGTADRSWLSRGMDLGEGRHQASPTAEAVPAEVPGAPPEASARIVRH